MTKSKATLSIETLTPSASPATVPLTHVKPNSIPMIGPTVTTLAQAAVLIRQGYTFADLPIDIFGPAGTIGFTLVQGTPDQHAIDAASVLLAENAAREERQYEKEVEAAAKRLIEERERAAKQAAIQAQIEAQQKQIRQLQASLASA